MHDIWVAGHVTRDTVRIAGSPDIEMPGGVAHYAAFTYQQLGLSAAILTKVARDDIEICLAGLRDAGVHSVAKESAATTRFENIYAQGQAGSRTQRVDGVAAPFAAQDLTDIGGRCVHLGPLTASDMPLGFIKAARRNFERVVLDLQGCLRAVTGREIVRSSWADSVAALAAVDILKASQAEAELMTGYADPVDAAKALAGQGPREVVITLGDAGSVVFADGLATRFLSIPARRAVDPTGCGDTYLAAYVALRLEEATPAAAAEFATAAASIKLENAGPLTATREEIANHLAEQRQRG